MPSREQMSQVGFVHPNPMIERHMSELAEIVAEIGMSLDRHEMRHPGFIDQVMIRANQIREAHNEFCDIIAGNEWDWEALDE